MSGVRFPPDPTRKKILLARAKHEGQSRLRLFFLERHFPRTNTHSETSVFSPVIRERSLSSLLLFFSFPLPPTCRGTRLSRTISYNYSNYFFSKKSFKRGQKFNFELFNFIHPKIYRSSAAFCLFIILESSYVICQRSGSSVTCLSWKKSTIKPQRFSDISKLAR